VILPSSPSRCMETSVAFLFILVSGILMTRESAGFGRRLVLEFASWDAVAIDIPSVKIQCNSDQCSTSELCEELA
jgi:hypothetical protein